MKGDIIELLASQQVFRYVQADKNIIEVAQKLRYRDGSEGFFTFMQVEKTPEHLAHIPDPVEVLLITRVDELGDGNYTVKFTPATISKERYANSVIYDIRKEPELPSSSRFFGFDGQETFTPNSTLSLPSEQRTTTPPIILDTQVGSDLYDKEKYFYRIM